MKVVFNWQHTPQLLTVDTILVKSDFQTSCAPKLKKINRRRVRTVETLHSDSPFISLSLPVFHDFLLCNLYVQLAFISLKLPSTTYVPLEFSFYLCWLQGGGRVSCRLDWV